MDIMLAEPEADFTGGQLFTPEVDGTTLRAPLHHRGDAVLFPSHKYHNVAPVTSGRRRVLVTELWEGPERVCAHRCSTVDECEYSLDRSNMARTAHLVSMMG